jgi:urocanate hydratase
MATSSSQGSTRTVDRALGLLAHVSTAERPPTLAEAARAVGLPLSTTSRLLRTLENQRYIRRTADGRYWPGAQMIQIAAVAMRTFRIFDLAQEHLEALSAESGESSFLAVPEGTGRAVYVRQVESSSFIRAAAWLGRTIPMNGTATGAALRGRVGPEGYATNRGAIEPDSVTAAAPVYAAGAEIQAAISVIGPAYRIDDVRLHDIGLSVVEHARTLSTEVGARVNGRGLRDSPAPAR